MSNVDVPQENGSPNDEIESPVDGPTPDWLKMATSSSSSPTLTDENTPDWLKNIQAGKSMAEEEKTNEPEQDPYAGMTDLERLLAEEGVDLEAVAEERPEGSEGMTARDWMIATSDDEVIRKRIGADAEGHAVPDDAADAAEEDDPFAGLSDIERLLAEEGVDLSSVSEERPEGAHGMSARDWMISTSDDEVIRKRIGAESTHERPAPVPSPKPDPASAPTPEDSGRAEAEDDLPDWLRDIEEEPASAPDIAGREADESTVIEDDLPDWLRDIEEETDAPAPHEEPEDDGMVIEDDLPDWLRDVEEESTSPDDVSAAPTAGAESSAAEQSDMPDWLRDAEETVSTPSQFEEGDDDKMIFEDDLPDWLKEADEAPEAPEAPAPAPPQPSAAMADDDDDDLMVIEEDLPDWLREVDDEPSPGPGASQTQEEELPTWLQEAETEAEPDTVPDVETVTSTTADDDRIVYEEGLPDWLREVQAETEDDLFETEAAADIDDDIIVADDLPDWLSEAQAVEDEPFEPSEPSPEDLITAVDEDELPDWLREVHEDTEELEFAGDEAPAQTFEAEMADVPPSAGDESMVEMDELPDWLREVEEETEVFTEKDVPAPAPQPVAVEPEAEISEEEVPVPTPAKAEPAPAPAEVEKAPPPAKQRPVAEPKPAAPTPKTADAVPDWLKKLREGTPKTVETAPHPVQPAFVPAGTPVPPRAPVASPRPVVASQASAAPAPVPRAVPEKPVLPSYDDLPQDPDARLNMAQTAKDKGDFEEASRIYDSLIRSNTHLEAIIDDMELAIRSYPSNYLLYQVMGDAMMRDGRLQSALDAYRTALEKLAT